MTSTNLEYPAPARGTQHRPLLAALWMLGAIFGFSAMAVAGREVQGQLDTFEIMLWRSLLGLIIVDAIALTLRRREELAPRFMGQHLLRNSAHFAGQNLWLYALTLIPLAQLFAVEFSYPIMVALAAPLLLGERLMPVKLLTAAIGFAGILLVARPWGVGGFSPGIIAAFGAALGFAGSAIVTKRLTRKVTTLGILHWLCAIQLGLALVFALWDGQMTWPAPASWLPLVVIGLSGLGAHYCLTTALSLAPASIVTPIDFLRLPLIGVVGMLLYGEPLDIWVFAGGAIIFGANWINLAADARAGRRPVPQVAA
ncbi:DMT family transporter [Frigidibacter sp.]|uniref:DMT family transporter n=1 Tax=Frigidibacter sp. TaxID=2586418 RepID=UPI0027373A50|nr:DMT family transporter [Frigidibacter sp.]MDP3342663.1 DMT family transporter [Frigidibacter sp.]